MTEGEGIFHTAPGHVGIGVIIGLGVSAVLSLVFGGPVWNEDFALICGLVWLAKYVDENAV